MNSRLPASNFRIVQRHYLDWALGNRELEVGVWNIGSWKFDSGTIQPVAFVRWDPLQDLLAVQQRMNRMSTGPTGWTPAVDILETEDRYVLMVELPGLGQNDVRLEHHDGRLTVAGVRRERESTCEQFHRIERGHGSFSRTFQLPLPVDGERITADLRDGVLTVTCPKSADGPTRQIHID